MGIAGFQSWIRRKFGIFQKSRTSRYGHNFNNVLRSRNYKRFQDDSVPNTDKDVVKNLFIDANGLLHDAVNIAYAPANESHEKALRKDPEKFWVDSQQVKSEGEFENYESVLDVFLRLLRDIVRITKPELLIYLAFDGPVPAAKIIQQRRRLAISSQEEPLFDRTQIKPGMRFMRVFMSTLRKRLSGKKLRSFFDNEINTFIKRNAMIKISDHTVPGEGEHKIMDLIKGNTADAHVHNTPYTVTMDKDLKQTVHVIYSADADMGLLTMLVSKKHKIIVVRQTHDYDEAKEMRNIAKKNLLESEGRDKEAKKIKIVQRWEFFDYYNIAKELEHSFKTKDYRSSIPIKDFVAISCFAGNDFLPPLPMMRRGDGDEYKNFEILIETYFKMKKLKKRTKFTSIVDETEKMMDLVDMSQFLLLLKTNHGTKRYKEMYQTNEALIAISDNYTSWQVLKDLPPVSQTKEVLVLEEDEEDESYDVETDNIEEEQVDPTKINDFIFDFVYTKFLKATDPDDLLIDNMCRQYIVGILFVLNYYKNPSRFDNYWFYPYHYAPPLGDLSEEFLKERKYKDEDVLGELIVKKYGKVTVQQTFTPLEHLSAILPLSKLHLLESESAIDFLTTNLAHLYYEDVGTDKAFVNQKFDHHNIPLINFPDMREIKDTLAELQTLSEISKINIKNSIHRKSFHK